MRHFGTHGPVNIIDNYVVARAERLGDFIKRVKLGRYIVLGEVERISSLGIRVENTLLRRKCGGTNGLMKQESGNSLRI